MDKDIKTPRVSIVMPVFNAEKYIKESINSILNQTFKDFEFLIIDDGSTDNTYDIIKSYRDPRIRLIKNKQNLKIVKTLNNGFYLARGEYIARMDADDISLPKRLERQVNFLDSNQDIDIVGTWIKLFGNNSKKIKYPTDPEDIKASLLFYNPIAHPTVMMRKKIIEKYGLFYNEFSDTQDRELWTRAIEHVKISCLKKYLLLYRSHKENVTKIFFKVKKEDARNIRIFYIKKYLNINPTDDEIFFHNTIKAPTDCPRELFLNKSEAWLLKLRAANKKTGFCKKKHFNKILADLWLMRCSENSRPGLQTLKIFKKSPLSKYSRLKSYKRILRLFIKYKINK